MRYVRAEKVLPPELLREVQKHHTGLIYVPGDPGVGHGPVRAA